MEEATYSFLPYLRVGLANKIAESDQDKTKMRGSFLLNLTVKGTQDSTVLQGEPISQAVQLYGPSDITGIDSRVIFKTEPLNWITNFEPNYLPYIDFYDEDFAWRYTPNKPNESLHRLRPWLALVVLEENEFAEGNKQKDKPLPSIKVEDPNACFPPPEELWAWAHVHVNADLDKTREEMQSSNRMTAVLANLDNVLHADKDKGYCRILCPRKLKANVAYHAFLIPSFEGGRKAGLGLKADEGDLENNFASRYAWGAPDQKEFPYYYRWYFRTGTVGDFEYLVRLLTPKPANDKIGLRDMDVQQPGWNIEGIDPEGELGGILKLGGALRVPQATTHDDWAKIGYPQTIQRDIADFLNAADDYQKPGDNPIVVSDPDDAQDPDPLITPPLYGRWHALVDRLLTDPSNNNWIHELNLDPRFRVTAGFGTKIIQDNQEEYMNAAWEQVGDVLKANNLIRFAQFSSEIMWQWYTLQFQPLALQQPEKLILFSAPLLKRVLINRVTAFMQLKRSIIPQAVVSTQIRKLLRPRSRLVKKLFVDNEKITPTTLLSRLNLQEISPAPLKTTPIALELEEKLAQFSKCFNPEFLTPEAVDHAPQNPEFRLTDADGRFKPEGQPDKFAEKKFKVALKEMYAATIAATKAAYEPPKEPLDMSILISGLVDKLHPYQTIPQMVLDKILLPTQLQGQLTAEKFDEVMHYPVFEIPMYKPLADLSSEYFLPNINLIDPNSIILLETNQKFIESYMVGLNHEMSRELLWREYPSDLRGSYFRQFWDVRSYLPEKDENLAQLKEKFKDIPELHRWSLISKLGEHDNREAQSDPNAATEEVVLVIRGELLKKYPTAVIYAQKAEWHRKQDGSIDFAKPRHLVTITDEEAANPPKTKLKTPLYSAKVEPDIYFFGFDLTCDDAKGVPNVEAEPGWFFVLKERAGEARFGLDIEGKTTKLTWNDLGWNDFGASFQDGNFIRIANSPIIQLSTTLPIDEDEKQQHKEDDYIKWKPDMDSADLAYILYQPPVMMAVHASDMLPTQSGV